MLSASPLWHLLILCSSSTWSPWGYSMLDFPAFSAILLSMYTFNACLCHYQLWEQSVTVSEFQNNWQVLVLQVCSSVLLKPLSCETGLENYLRKHDREACAIRWLVKVRQKIMHSWKYQWQTEDTWYREKLKAFNFLELKRHPECKGSCPRHS